jgi:hypothetical protein
MTKHKKKKSLKTSFYGNPCNGVTVGGNASDYWPHSRYTWCNTPCNGVTV